MPAHHHTMHQPDGVRPVSQVVCVRDGSGDGWVWHSDPAPVGVAIGQARDARSF